jgi:hypothetical protein
VKRLRRIILNALTVLSLLLCVATTGLWVRSYRAYDEIGFAKGDRWSAMVASSRGGILCGFRGTYSEPVEQHGWWRHRYLANPFDFSWGSLPGFYVLFDHCGFALEGAKMNQTHYHMVIVPTWFILLVMFSLPFQWWRQHRRDSKRKLLGLCGNCGYDLRATPDRCPECGTIPAKVKM